MKCLCMDEKTCIPAVPYPSHEMTGEIGPPQMFKYSYVRVLVLVYCIYVPLLELGSPFSNCCPFVKKERNEWKSGPCIES